MFGIFFDLLKMPKWDLMKLWAASEFILDRFSSVSNPSSSSSMYLFIDFDNRKLSFMLVLIRMEMHEFCTSGMWMIISTVFLAASPILVRKSKFVTFGLFLAFAGAFAVAAEAIEYALTLKNHRILANPLIAKNVLRLAQLQLPANARLTTL